VLPARLDRYDKSMLDMLCLTGEIGWARLPDARAGAAGARGDSGEPGARSATLNGGTPIALVVREHAEAWRALRAIDPERQRSLERALPANAHAVLTMLRERGALFFHELTARCTLTEAAAWEALGPLVGAGLVSSDGFAGVRSVVRARKPFPPARARQDLVGRWSAEAGAEARMSRDAAIEIQARALLRRYGVVFRRLLARETCTATWRELVMFFRTLEARGEIRGGRFVAGMAGEQFARPDAVEQLREVRRQGRDGTLVTLSAADPLNLTGIVVSGDRVRAATSTRLVFRNGLAIAAMEGDFLRPLAEIEPAMAADVASALAGRRVSGVVSGFVGR
jgi:ATP-dependent Lhr-like helicase